jgi:cytoskeletal protein RodZ
MSLTLGEKLRQAREERGITITEVSEQTRISPLYLEAIENDDFSPLPGGIFNKGFVKSFAKYVGVDENEALQDYARLVTQQTGSEENLEPQTYKPEVLTDDRASSSNLLTIVFAVVILGLMTWGILSLVNYIQDQQNQPTANANTTNTNTNANIANTNTNTNITQPIPSTDEIKVEFKTTGEPVSVSYRSDGKGATKLVTADSPLNLEGKQSVYFSYAKSLASNVQITLNGRQIKLPTEPANPKRIPIEIEITKDDIARILQSGEITFNNPTPAG